MRAVCLHDRDAIARVLQRDPYLHLYSLGDLDDAMWPHTTWYGLRDEEHPDEIAEICLLFSGLQLPTLIAVTARPALMTELLRLIGRLLPRRFYCHLTPGLEAALATPADTSRGATSERRYRLISQGTHLRMALTRRERLHDLPAADTVRLTRDDEAEIRELYAAAYPETWFELLMLDTGMYYGCRQEGRLVSIAGVHVYSPTRRVAALGNIATHPDYRRRGCATAVVGVLCRALLEHADYVGLNVGRDNVAAIGCYERLGFTTHGEYKEYMVEAELT